MHTRSEVLILQTAEHNSPDILDYGGFQRFIARMHAWPEALILKTFELAGAEIVDYARFQRFSWALRYDD